MTRKLKFQEDRLKRVFYSMFMYPYDKFHSQATQMRLKLHLTFVQVHG